MDTYTESLLDDDAFRAALDSSDVSLTSPRPPREPRWFEDAAPEPLRAAPARTTGAFDVLGFIVMMAIGGMSAALLFQDRLAQIFR